MQTVMQYGSKGIALHFGIGAVCYAAIYVALGAGLKSDRILRLCRLETKAAQTAGKGGVAYLIYKGLMPLRLALTAGLLQLWCRKSTS